MTGKRRAAAPSARRPPPPFLGLTPRPAGIPSTGRRVVSGLPAAGLVFLLLAALGCSSGDSGESGASREYLSPTSPGPYRAGHSQTTFHDTARDRELPVDLWYPVAPDAVGAAVKYLGLLSGQALEGAVVETAGSPFPLIVFSHGSSSVAIQNYPVCEHLATHGYFVAAPSHIGNTLFRGDPALVDDMLETRPEDVSATIDWMLGGEHGPLVDQARIGVMGHSYGGYTSIAVAGAEAHPASYDAFCADPEARNEGCMLTGSFPDPVESANFGDARVKAAIGMSAGMFEIWGAEGLAETRAHVMLMSGTSDKLTPHDREAARIYPALPAPKSLLIFEGANHYSFTILCPLLAPIPGLCADGPLDAATMESAINAYSTAFFGLYVKGIPAYGQDLDPAGGLHFAGVTPEYEP